MEIEKYIDQKNDLYNSLLTFIDESDDFSILQQEIEKENFQENHDELYHFIRLLVSITDNHYRKEDFFQKIEQIFDSIKKDIINIFNKYEIYKYLESNKRLLLYAIKNSIITLDSIIVEYIEIKTEENGTKYSDFFIPEINSFKKCQWIEFPPEYIDNMYEYDRNRLLGENDSYICSLIRQDLVEDFISYVNRKNLSLSSKISPSIFETNSYLNKDKSISLIEYASFFGSIQIFQYLFQNNAELTKELFNYSIHSNNADFLVNKILSNKILPSKITDESCFQMAIKCHHNDFSNFIEENFKTNASNLFTKFIWGITYSNYMYIPNDFFKEIDKNTYFTYLLNFKYTKIVNLLIDSKKDEVKSTIGIQVIFFLIIKFNKYMI